MDILLINHYAGSPKHGMEYRPYYLGREWARLGHRVTVVAASRSHLRIQEPLVNGDATEEHLDGVRYVWLKTPGYCGNGVRRAVNVFAFVGQLCRHARRIVGDRPPEAVIASSTHPLDIFPAARIARRCQGRLVYEVHDLWPLSLIELGGMSPWHPFCLLIGRAERLAYRRADRVVSLLPAAAGHMRAHGMAPHKFVHIPNGIDVGQWQADTMPIPEEHRAALAALRAEGRFLVGYVGSHAVAYALDALVEAAQLLQSQPVGVVLVGQGQEKERLRRKAGALGLPNLVFLPPVPKPAVPALLASLDALYLGLRRKPIFRFGVSPNKLMDYMMAGRPVIQAIEAGNDLVAESRCGISCRAEDPAAIAEAILGLSRSTPEQRRAMGQSGQEYVFRHHDYAVLARRFLEVIA